MANELLSLRKSKDCLTCHTNKNIFVTLYIVEHTIQLEQNSALLSFFLIINIYNLTNGYVQAFIYNDNTSLV